MGLRTSEEILAAKPDRLREIWSSLLARVDRTIFRGELGKYLIRTMGEGLRSGNDGWRDDDLAHVKPRGFDPTSIRVPAQTWHGERDCFVPFADGRWFAARVPGADVHLGSNEGHLTMIARHVPDAQSWLDAKS